MENNTATPTSDVTFKYSFHSKAASYHERIPGIRKLPFSVVAIIALVFIVNLLVWFGVGVILVSNFPITCAQPLTELFSPSMGKKRKECQKCNLPTTI
jgi:hypothetical protein